MPKKRKQPNDDNKHVPVEIKRSKRAKKPANATMPKKRKQPNDDNKHVPVEIKRSKRAKNPANATMPKKQEQPNEDNKHVPVEIKRFKSAKNPAVEEAVTQMLTYAYSGERMPKIKEVLANVKGCSITDVTDREAKQMSDLFHIRKKVMLQSKVAFYHQPYYQFCMGLKQVPEEVKSLFPKINQLIADKAAKFRILNDTKESLKQMLFNDELIKIVDDSKGKNALDIFKEFFEDLGFKKKGVLLDSMLSHAMYTNSDEEHHQRPHTDYTFPKETAAKGKQYHAWTAIVAMNPEGTCLNIWREPGYPTNIKISYGEVFFFRSDVVHSGGRLSVNSRSSGCMYERLHFYLPTKWQPADPRRINITHRDNMTELDDIYYVPNNPWVHKNLDTKPAANSTKELKKK
jgi:hypothetical protein